MSYHASLFSYDKVRTYIHILVIMPYVFCKLDSRKSTEMFSLTPDLPERFD